MANRRAAAATWVEAESFPDFHMPRLTERGYFRGGRPVRIIRGKDRECHSNALRLWLAGYCAELVSGFALWRNTWDLHSWCMDHDGKIIETTTRRDGYFGANLTADEIVREYAPYIGDAIWRLDELPEENNAAGQAAMVRCDEIERAIAVEVGDGRSAHGAPRLPAEAAT